MSVICACANTDTKVKICDIRDVGTAHQCDVLGADYIGLHQIYFPMNQDRMKLFCEIIDVAPTLIPVLVTKILDENILRIMVDAVGFQLIQLHEKCSSDQLRIIRRTVNQDVGIISVVDASDPDFSFLREAAKIANFILIDSSMRGGTGFTSRIEQLKFITDKLTDVPYFIAGGLTPDNVSSYIDALRPFGVDVQSGVEYEEKKHVKDPLRLQQFIAEVKDPRGD